MRAEPPPFARPGSRRGPTVATAAAASLTLALVAVLSFRAGGYIVMTASLPVVAYLAAAAILPVVARPAPPRDALLLCGAAGLAAYALWSGLSVLWSVGPDLSWVSFDYAALYAAVVGVAVLLRPGRWQLRFVGYGYLVCVAAVAVYALLGKVLSEVVTHAHEYARLQQPLGYWNVLAVVLVMGVPLALSAAARPGWPAALRAAACACSSLLLMTLFFTFSRGGFLALAICLIVFFAATRARLGSLLSLLVAAVPIGLVLLHVRGLSTLFAATGDEALRTAQGHTLGAWALVAFAAAAALQLGVALLQHRWRPRPTVARAAGWAVLALVVLLAVGGPLTYISRHGGVSGWISARYHAFVGGSAVEQGEIASRLLVISSNGRLDLYREALDGFPHNPAVGTGAGTFAFTNYRYRTTALVVKHAHSQWFNALSELGVVGLALLAAAVLCLLAAAVRAVWRYRRDAERPLLAACLAVAVAFTAHMSVDWDWDMAAATIAFLLLTATAATYAPAPEAAVERAAAEPVEMASEGPEAVAERAGSASGDDPAADSTAATAEPVGAAEAGAATPADSAGDMPAPAPRRRLPLPLALAGCGLLLTLAASWLFPYLSLRSEAAAVASAEHHPQRALRQAQRAHSLDPLAADALVTRALLEQQLGRPQQALVTLRAAARLQPQNFRVHYYLGLLLATAFGRRAEATAEFARALSLNPLDSLSQNALKQLGR